MVEPVAEPVSDPAAPVVMPSGIVERAEVIAAICACGSNAVKSAQVIALTSIDSICAAAGKATPPIKPASATRLSVVFMVSSSRTDAASCGDTG